MKVEDLRVGKIYGDRDGVEAYRYIGGGYEYAFIRLIYNDRCENYRAGWFDFKKTASYGKNKNCA